MKYIEAKDTDVFVVNEHLIIKKVNLYDFICESLDETTTPTGVGSRLFCREEITYDDNKQLKTTFQVFTFGVRGSRPSHVKDFETEEERDEFLFQSVHDDFQEDYQRDTSYFATVEEALEQAAYLYVDTTQVDFNVAKSIIRKLNCIHNHKKQTK